MESRKDGFTYGKLLRRVYLEVWAWRADVGLVQACFFAPQLPCLWFPLEGTNWFKTEFATFARWHRDHFREEEGSVHCYVGRFTCNSWGMASVSQPWTSCLSENSGPVDLCSGLVRAASRARHLQTFSSYCGQKPFRTT